MSRASYINTNILKTLLLFINISVFTKFVEMLWQIVIYAHLNMNIDRPSMLFDILPEPSLLIDDRLAIILKLVVYELYKSSY